MYSKKVFYRLHTKQFNNISILQCFRGLSLVVCIDFHTNIPLTKVDYKVEWFLNCLNRKWPIIPFEKRTQRNTLYRYKGLDQFLFGTHFIYTQFQFRFAHTCNFSLTTYIKLVSVCMLGCFTTLYRSSHLTMYFFHSIFHILQKNSISNKPDTFCEYMI